VNSIHVSGERPYEVWLGDGALAQLERAPGRVAVVVDENVERLHGARLRAALAPHDPAWFVLPSGERHKTLDTAGALWDWLGELRLERRERVVAVGGGVTGDLAGFVASTWRRGVPFVQVPTTLLAMVDASVGGKVGVDTARGKNLVGAFWPPAQVLADTTFLATLPVRERWCGLVEVAKTALLAGDPLLSLVEAQLEALADGVAPVEEVVAACVRFKADVVQRDPTEQGERAVLNLGHTVGHALEVAGGFDRLTHGEAVAWGLRATIRLSGLSPGSREARLVARLPAVTLDGLDEGAVLDAMLSDKKSAGGKPRFVLLERAGRSRHGCHVDDDAWRSVVRELLSEGREVAPASRP
jgi:3-dehydroquinate synthase